MEATAPKPVPAEREDANGVDLTLIRAMLEMTPTERIRMLQDQIEFAASIRRGQANPDR